MNSMIPSSNLVVWDGSDVIDWINSQEETKICLVPNDVMDALFLRQDTPRRVVCCYADLEALASQRLYRHLRHICLMLKNRGDTFSYSSVIQTVLDDQNIRLCVNGREFVFLCFCLKGDLTKKMLVEQINSIRFEGKESFLIVPDEVYTFAKEKKITLTDPGIFMLKESQLTYDPTTNFLNPKFQRVSIDERNVLEKSYGSFEKFPKMLHTDPVALWYGFSPGDVIRITRDYVDPPDLYYRYVVRPF